MRVRTLTADDERFPRKVFGETSWKTYGEVAAEAKAFGAGLRRLGMEPMPLEAAQAVTDAFAPIQGPHAMVIYEETCAQWTTACLGAFGQSLVVATSYATLGMGAVAEALNQTAAPVILCNYKDVSKVAAVCDSTCPALTHIVYTRNSVEKDAPELAKQLGRLAVLEMADVVAMGKASPCDFVPPTKDHVGVIMYTSGSTGKPKGVMLKHSALVASVAGLEDYFNVSIGKRATTEEDQEVYLAYLPTAHILEFSAEVRVKRQPTILALNSLCSIGQRLVVL
jgi:long-chain acyl-CoA synthetase